MKKYFLYGILIAAILSLTGCVGQIIASVKTLETVWGEDNLQLKNKLGLKSYDGMSKEDAMNAMAIACQRLDLLVENADFKVGFIVANATAPRPLNAEEFEVVKTVETPRAKSIVPIGFTWDVLNDYNNQFNFTFLETGEGVQISIRARLEYRKNNPNYIPVSEPPPKALEIIYPKIWNEFEKIAFIQNKTLK